MSLRLSLLCNSVNRFDIFNNESLWKTGALFVLAMKCPNGQEKLFNAYFFLRTYQSHGEVKGLTVISEERK